MASPRDVRAGRAYVELGVDDKIAAGLKKAAAKLKAFGAGVRNVGVGLIGIGAAITGPLAASAGVFAQMGSKIYDMSKRTGISAEKLTELGYAANQTGTDLDTFEGVIKRMQKSIAGIADESEGTTGSLDKLGISFEDLAGKSPDQQFEIIAAALNKIEDPTLKAAAAMSVLGKSGTAILPMIDELASLQARARELGVVMTTEDAKAADKFGDILSDLWAQLKRVNFLVGEAVGKFLQPYAEAATRVMKTIIDWVKEHQKLVGAIAAVGVVLVAAGAAFVVLGTVITSVGVVLGAAAVSIVAIGTALGALVTPIGFVTVAFAALGASLTLNTETGAKALSYLGDKFSELAAIAKDTFGGIADALMAGDIQLAAKILWTGLKLAWTTGTADLRKIWIEFQSDFAQTFASVVGGIQLAWIEAISVMTKAWAGFATTVKIGAAEIQNALVQVGAAIADKLGDKTAKGIAAVSTAQKDAAVTSAVATGATDIQKAEIDKNTAQLEVVGKTAEALAKAQIDADEKSKALQDELTALRKQLADQKTKAATERAGITPQPDIKKIQDAAEATIAKSNTARGTFSAAAVQSLQGGSAVDQIAANTKKAADTLDKISRVLPTSVVA
jgi:hypothetical protein